MTFAEKGVVKLLSNVIQRGNSIISKIFIKMK